MKKNERILLTLSEPFGACRVGLIELADVSIGRIVEKCRKRAENCFQLGNTDTRYHGFALCSRSKCGVLNFFPILIRYLLWNFG